MQSRERTEEGRMGPAVPGLCSRQELCLNRRSQQRSENSGLERGRRTFIEKSGAKLGVLSTLGLLLAITQPTAGTQEADRLITRQGMVEGLGLGLSTEGPF